MNLSVALYVAIVVFFISIPVIHEVSMYDMFKINMISFEYRMSIGL